MVESAQARILRVEPDAEVSYRKLSFLSELLGALISLDGYYHFR